MPARKVVQPSPQEKVCTLRNSRAARTLISPARQHTYKVSRIDFSIARHAKSQESAAIQRQHLGEFAPKLGMPTDACVSTRAQFSAAAIESMDRSKASP